MQLLLCCVTPGCIADPTRTLSSTIPSTTHSLYFFATSQSHNQVLLPNLPPWPNHKKSKLASICLPRKATRDVLPADTLYGAGWAFDTILPSTAPAAPTAAIPASVEDLPANIQSLHTMSQAQSKVRSKPRVRHSLRALHQRDETLRLP